MPKKVAIVMEGSRGDIQPYLVAALSLKEAGYSVLVLGPSDCAPFAAQFGLDYFDHYTINTKAVCQSEAYAEAYTSNNFFKLTQCMAATKDPLRAEFVGRMAAVLKNFQPDLIIGCYLVICDCLCMGLALQTPVLFLGLQVMIASNHLAAFGMFPKLPAFMNMNLRLWHWLSEHFANELNKSSAPIIEKLMQMPREDFTPTMEEFLNICSCSAKYPVLLAASPTLHAPLPPDFNSNVHALGALFLDTKEQTGPEFGGAELKAMDDFLAAGDAPVYIGYGSMTCNNGKFMSLLSLRALMATGERGIVLSGWAKMSTDFEGEPDAAALQAYCKEKVLFMDTAPHGVLFPRCKVIVHHGGAGTFNASVLSGVPTVVVPIFLDQYYHSTMANERGFGIGLKAMSSTTPAELAAAIRKCIDSPEIRQTASTVAKDMAKENGAAAFVQQIDRFMEEYVDTGRYLKERDELRKEIKDNSWKNMALNFLARFNCCCEREQSIG